ncbi:protein ARABIDILLO 1-like isoform X1 [Salvia hispanica]|uniref:protein ARABIDILLO 1-like isoform X1 n=1 Tax=Salvia hispanica TaxID=49212 RepID=UPI00200923BE|nr:protein ARABIDILLO 1-like isoform X1 [Salvia hispanica]
MRSRRVRGRVVRRGKEKLDCPDIDGNLSLDEGMLDWTSLPDDTAIQVFSCLSHRDRASLSSTCRAWRAIGKSPCLWKALDLRHHNCDTAVVTSLASRCESLHKVRFRGSEAAVDIIQLKAKNLREISGDCCRKMTDVVFSVLVARHTALESLTIGPDFCEGISSDAIYVLAICCPKLRKLRLSGFHEVDARAINALAQHCPNLADVGFIDCRRVDETALGNVTSLSFLSVAGTTNIKWNLVSQQWTKLPNLIALDVSRTNIAPVTVTSLFTSSCSLKALCALNCPSLEQDASFATNNYHQGKVLLAIFTDILRGAASLFVDMPKNDQNVFLDWRNTKDRKTNEILNWLEWIISNSLLRVSEINPGGLDNFWLNQGASLLINFLQSPQEEVQERAAMALATFVVIDEENASIHTGRAEAVIRYGGIRLLLNLANSWKEGLQAEAAKAIANLSVNANVAKAVADEEGINILVNLARSANRFVAEEAVGGLWNLSVGEDHKGSFAEAGRVKALLDLIIKWSRSIGGEGVTERAAGALANLAADENCSMAIASVGGLHALATLARTSKVDGVLEQAARALANLAAHGESNNSSIAVGSEAGALEALVELTRSAHNGVRQEAAGALWNLSFDDRNREGIAAAGGVEALVALASFGANASQSLQERVAGALWGLSVSETNSIAIGQEGGVAPLLLLAQSAAEDVHETAVGAIWNLAFNPGNALRIVDEGGVFILIHICTTSASKMARFMSSLALAYMFDGRMHKIALEGTSAGGTSKIIKLDNLRKLAFKCIDEFVMSFSNPQAFAAAASSSAPTALVQVMEAVSIEEAGQLRCSGAEIGRFVSMLRNPAPTLKGCAAFALLQFTIIGGRHSPLHAKLLQDTASQRLLRAAAAAASAPPEAKIFARIVLRNVEQQQVGSSSI